MVLGMAKTHENVMNFLQDLFDKLIPARDSVNIPNLQSAVQLKPPTLPSLIVRIGKRSKHSRKKSVKSLDDRTMTRSIPTTSGQCVAAVTCQALVGALRTTTTKITLLARSYYAHMRKKLEFSVDEEVSKNLTKPASSLK